VINALMIDVKDNVAVVIEEIKKGAQIRWEEKGKTKTLTAPEDVTIYHKIAVREIRAGDKVVKYGEHIGEAGRDISPGEHVHVHNVISVREEL